ncbi:MAG: AMP-binding protein, partial [Minwuia sp.]|nr:AMP-binding protein [Minwuia sp.]
MNDGFTWEPTQQYIDNAELTRFVEALGCASEKDLLGRAAADPEWFWDSAIRALDIRFGRPYSQVRDISDGLQNVRWCIGGTMNFCDNVLDRHRGTEVWQKPAIVWHGEDDSQRSLTYAELDQQVRELAAGLRAVGVGQGDAVGIYMPVLPETPVAFLAVARIGAIISPLFSGFGAEAIVKRLNDAEAVAVITADQAIRRGS